jgi:hypothetical protein
LLALITAVSTSYAQASSGVQADASSRVEGTAATQGGASSIQTTSTTSAQANASAQAAPITVREGTAINARLVSSLDARKNKLGDRAEAEITQDVKSDSKVVLRKGTRLVGGVTHAESRAAGSSRSSLGVMFDEALLKDGQRIPVQLTIQALAISQSAARLSNSETASFGQDSGVSSSAGASGGGGLLGGALDATSGTVAGVSSSVGGAPSGVAGGVGSNVSTVVRSQGAVGGLTAAGALTSDSRGVFGIEGVSLDSSSSTNTQGTLIVSSTRDVQISSNTQLVLRASAGTN